MILVACLSGCKSGPFSLIKPASPHEQYENRLINSGLDKNTMGQRWISKSKNLFVEAKQIKIPYKEMGYFAAEKIEGAAFTFNLERGQKLNANLSTQSLSGFVIYMDIWEQRENGEYKKLAFADSASSGLQWEAKRSGSYLIRLQPELLTSGSYNLELNVVPSLAFPLKNASKKQIQSFFGVGRDNGARRHEGVDIFSGFRTPVLAVAEGTVTRVNENNLGGRVVWLRPKGKDYTVYYAHLDEQIAIEGREVLVGDTLGLMGNTGNAKTTPPHLHFGIYTSGGAVDPLPFIDPQVLPPPKITSDITKLNTTLRTLNSTVKFSDSEQRAPSINLKQNTIARVLAASGNQYKIELPNGKVGYVNANLLTETKPLTTRKIAANSLVLYDTPNLAAGIKANLLAGQTITVLGNFDNFELVSTSNNIVGWISTK
jgi:murein DD-endopeptidase MepM/ murein hydrolase activator NlpD